MLTRISSLGLFASQYGAPNTIFEIMPLYMAGNIFVTYPFLFISGWIRNIGRKNIFGINVPYIRWYVFVSGLATSLQMITAFWAYAFKGVSIVFVALLMKGGILIIAPLVDMTIKGKKRRIYWPSWAAGALSLFAITISFLERSDIAITLICAFDISLYLVSYFIKLSIMSRWAKTRDANERKRYIAEEQITISVVLPVVLAVMAYLGGFLHGGVFEQVRHGFTVLPFSGFVVAPVFIGASAAGAGIFASLVFLDRRENIFCVSAVQSMSIIAGTIATVMLTIFYNQPPLSAYKLAGAVIIIGAIVLLALRDRVEKKKSKSSGPAVILYVGPSACGKSTLSNYWRAAFPEYHDRDDTPVIMEYLAVDGEVAAARDRESLKSSLGRLLDSARFIPDIVRSYMHELERGGIPQPRYCSSIGKNVMKVESPDVWDDAIVRLAKTLDPDKKYIVQFARGHDRNYLDRFGIEKEEVYRRTIRLLLESMDKKLSDRTAIVHITSDFETRAGRNSERRITTGQDLPDEVLEKIFREDIFEADHYIDDPDKNLRRGILKVGNRTIPVSTVNNNRVVERDEMPQYFTAISSEAMHYFTSKKI